MDGILLIDKPRGLSSAAVVGCIKRTFGLKKIGHAGTLDPFATGLLVLCLGRATRISRYFLGGDKAYEATLRLGFATDTLDPEGAITEQAPIPQVTPKAIRDIFKQFSGPIRQIPPAYSALKHNGVPLYRLARQGNPVQKPARSVVVHTLALQDIALPDIRFSVHCSSGTYIRTLAADFARSMGTVGHLVELRRTECCGFSIHKALNLEECLEKARQTPAMLPDLIPMTEALHFLPGVRVNNALTEKIFHGKVLSTAEILPSVPHFGPVRVLNAESRLVAVIRRNEDDPDFFCYDAVLADGTA
ncbi:tRNA pseudouridine(55) synthase TruB [Desulfobotulus sp. H1]|uniref:tRNA pseudouridine synthase B n=1 Tax=Desulfobotulus pelophilus TaxID=2823377 RepID=A0ABT3NCJ6_9BACT|nr:tRNA pseudouridine(55) synthase TruB [Desulfobotulus pelophilus]MCW7755182.1 tRNA pseudouridine(55) synthase TruB [Desulfobotulus pelophilus]